MKAGDIPPPFRTKVCSQGTREICNVPADRSSCGRCRANNSRCGASTILFTYTTILFTRTTMPECHSTVRHEARGRTMGLRLSAESQLQFSVLGYNGTGYW